MKKIILMAAAMMASCSMMAQSYNMVVTFSNGSTQTFGADSVTNVKFEEAQSVVTITNLLDSKVVPDETLRSYIKTTYAKGSNYFTNVQAAKVTGKFSIPYNVQDATGIEYFTGIDSISCNSNSELVSLDLSALKKLTYMTIESCSALQELKTADSAPIKYLDLNYTRPKNYDYTRYASTLEQMYLAGNRLSSFDFSIYKKVRVISMASNELTKVNISGLDCLSDLYLEYNSITSLSLTDCPKLQMLNVVHNKSLTKITCSGCPNIEYLYLANCYFSKLPLSDLKANIKGITCQGNQFTTLDLTGYTSLLELEAQENALTSINLKDCSALTCLRLEETKLTSLDLSGNTELTEFHCYQTTTLSSLDLSHNTKLTTVNLFNDGIKEINVGEMPNILWFACYGNQFKRIDISRMNKECPTISLRSNAMLKEIKVWDDFDFDNPPESISKDSGAQFVKEFTTASE